MSTNFLASVLLLFVVATPAPPQSQTNRGTLHPRLADRLTTCRVPGLDEDVLCGRYEVFENRPAGSGRKISLRVVVLPATSVQVADDPLVFLAGGGVAPATRYAGFFGKGLARLRLHRDILLVDQRGTGGSNELDCNLSSDASSPEYRDAGLYVEAVRRCREALGQKADLRFYTTSIAMDDLDDVRTWLGYPRLNLLGVSYGTQAAMVYLRQHPEHVRTLTLQGVVPFDVPMWLEVPRSMQQGLEQVFAACRTQRACHAAFPRFEQELSELTKTLAEKPIKIDVAAPEGGEKVEVTLDAEVLRRFVTSYLYSADRIHDLPLLIHRAAGGDGLPIAHWLAEWKLADRRGHEIPEGVYLSIVCNEDWHFDPAALPSAVAGTFIGELRSSREMVACREWPRGWVPENYWTPVRSSVPALIMTGALDAVTPRRYGERAAKSFPNARLLVLPGRGHNDADDCVLQLDTDFVIAGTAQGVDTSCLGRTPPQSFALTDSELAKE